MPCVGSLSKAGILTGVTGAITRGVFAEQIEAGGDWWQRGAQKIKVFLSITTERNGVKQDAGVAQIDRARQSLAWPYE